MRKITNEIIENFKLYLYESEKSNNTIEKYMRDIRFFKKWLDEQELNKTIVLEYKKQLCTRYAPSSVNSMLSSINALFIYLNWDELKVKNLKIQKQIFANKNREMSKAEYERLLLTAKSQDNEKLYYLMQTIASTGIRVSEDIYCKG